MISKHMGKCDPVGKSCYLFAYLRANLHYLLPIKACA